MKAPPVTPMMMISVSETEKQSNHQQNSFQRMKKHGHMYLSLENQVLKTYQKENYTIDPGPSWFTNLIGEKVWVKIERVEFYSWVRFYNCASFLFKNLFCHIADNH